MHGCATGSALCRAINPAYMKTTLRNRRLLAAASVAVSLLLAPMLNADPLLTAAYEAQLEAWLGQGDLNLTNIFTKTAGSTSYDLHGAVDGQGATFMLMNIYGKGASGTFDLVSQVVGGYNPQSWNSSNSYNLTPNDSDRTAFIYNLTSSTIQRQNLTGEGASGSGAIQTFNAQNYYGLSFGGGIDLQVSHGAGGPFANLDYGLANNYSYGGTSNGAEIVSGGPNFQDPYTFVNSANFYVGDLEVYTFSRVPDPASTLGLMGVSLFALAAFRRRVV